MIKDYEIVGNDRIPNETILMFSNFKIGDDIDENKINIILKISQNKLSKCWIKIKKWQITNFS